MDPGGNTATAATILRVAAAVFLAGAAVIHFFEAPVHFHDALHGYFLLGVGVLQALAAVLLLQVRPRPLYGAIAAGSLLVALVWVVSRTVGMPVGHHEGLPEPVGFPDATATSFEVATALALAALMTGVGRRSLSRRLVVALASVLVIASGGVVFAVESLPAPRIDDCVARDTGWEVARCLLPHFREQARSGASGQALAALHGAFVSGALDDCHLPAHHLGHITYEFEGDITFLAADGSGRCFDGLIHGGVELAVEDGAERSGDGWDVSEICRPLDALEVHDACVHGTGHGLMHLTDWDVQSSLAGCESHAGRGERGRCAGGVLMENVMQHLTLPQDGFRRAATAACRNLELSGSLMALCHQQVGEISMFYFRHDLEPVREICGHLDSPGAEGECLEGAEAQLRLVEGAR